MAQHTPHTNDGTAHDSRTGTARRGNLGRWLRLGLLALALTGTLACINRPTKRATPEPHVSFSESVPQNTERDVDILFVIDDSGSMADEQQRLRDNFVSLMTTLKGTRGGLPNVHIGVVSTDIGTGAYTSGGCTPNGQDGRLLTGSCPALGGANYIVDVEPTGCRVDKVLDAETGALTQCTASDCAQAHCAEPGTTLVVDELGCPRCRNYAGATLEQVFGCVADRGTEGCGFEQPLEAMHRALDDHPDNQGFVRENAYLTVVFVTDEDDCSAADPTLFADDVLVGNLDLGPWGDFRCFDFGVVCDEDSRSAGTKHNCRPAEGDRSMMHDLGRYQDLLRELKDESMVIVAAIAGPVGEGAVTVTVDGDRLNVARSCGEGGGPYDGGKPATRLHAFVESMTAESDLAWASTSICADSYDAALTGIGNKLVALMDTCPPAAFKGCHAPVFDGQGRVDVESCAPQCTITDTLSRGGSDELTRQLPRCLEVCAGGPCDGNTEPAKAYADGQPAARDEHLPVEACWYVQQNSSCAVSNGAELVIARREDPPPRSFTTVSCAGFQTTESLCNDGRDNDEDGLTDADDPDCTPAL